MRRQEKPLLSWWLSTRQTDGISVKLQRNFCARLYPTKAQEAGLFRLLDVHCRLYNAGLQERKGAWERRGVSRNHCDLATHLKAVREGDPEAAFANFPSPQQTLRRLEKAFTLSGTLTDRYSLIAVEDLQIQNLVHGMPAKAIHDAGWGVLRGMPASEGENTGSQLIAVRPHGTSRHWSRCGTLAPKDLRVRLHVCHVCGLELDRDVNAARTVLALALKPLTARTEPSVKSPALAGRSREAAPR